MERYEYRDGKSSKFWQIEQQGSDLHISWGKIGTNGQSQVKSFDSDAKAEAAKNKLVAEKTGKGYAPMAIGATPKVPSTKPVASAAPASAPSKTTRPRGVSEATAPAEGQASPIRADEANANTSTAASETSPVLNAGAPAASFDAPREAIEAWLTRRRETPGVDERALQAWPRVLQLVIDSVRGKKNSGLTPAQVQRGAQVDDDTMHLIGTYLIDSGWSHDSGFSGLRWLGKRDGNNAAHELAKLQVNLPNLLADLVQQREAAWPPLAPQEPGAVWPMRFAAVLQGASVSDWPLRSTQAVDVPAAPPGTRSVAESWDMLRKIKFTHYDATRSDPVFAPALKRFAQRICTPVATEPDTASDEILLSMCLEIRGENQVRAMVTHIVAYLVQAHGLAQVLRMLAAVSQWGFVYGPAMTWSLHLNQLPDSLFRRPDEPLFEHLRRWVLAASDAEWQAAQAAALEVLPCVPEAERVWFSLLLAESGELAEAVLASYGHTLPRAAHWLLVTLPEGAGLRRVMDVKISGEDDSIYDTPSLLAVVQFKLGDDALKWMIRGSFHDGIAAALAATNSPEAIVALAKQASASKESQARLRLALARWPLAGAIGLARVCAQGGKDVTLLKPLLRQTMAELGPALALVPAWLTPAARDLVQALQTKGGGVGAVAPAEALPAVLRNPPWLQAKKRLAVKALALAPLAVNEASSGEQPPLTGWEARGRVALPGLLRMIRANPTGMMAEAQHWGSTELALMAARVAFKLKTLRKEGLQWLLRWPEHAIGGLIAPALGKAGEARDVAAKALRFLAGKGHHALLMQMAASYDDPAVVPAVQAVLDEDPLDLHPSKIPVLPALWQPRHWTRPKLKNGAVLGDEAMTAFGQMLAFPRVDGLYEGIAQVVAACEPDSLAEFGWEMFSAWLADGAPSKEGWMFSSLAFLGNDEVARRLTPLIRAWPGESAHARAVAGLDVLEGIGTDTALMLLNGIAQKVKFKGLQDKAREKINAIAKARGLSTEELEDRLAPDLGLDERGALVLDFGPRQFQVGFDEALKPWVREFTDGVAGARLKDLPKPNKADDADKARAATERYKLLKKDAKTIAAQQIQRLETAMCQQRRWSAENFRLFLADHPLVRHIAQRLIWGVYAVEGVASEGESGEAGELVHPNFGGQLLACFRLAEDGSLSTADDEPFELPAHVGEGKALRIGVPHALDLPVQDAQAFGQLFADYELLQPFEQVGRETHTLTDAEKAAKELNRWKGRKVPTGRILGLANKAWRKGDAQDGGGIWYFSKPLADGRVIELSFDPGIIVGMVDEEPEQTLGSLTLGRSSRWGGIDSEATDLWQALDAIAASELIRDMEALTAP